MLISCIIPNSAFGVNYGVLRVKNIFLLASLREPHLGLNSVSLSEDCLDFGSTVLP